MTLPFRLHSLVFMATIMMLSLTGSCTCGHVGHAITAYTCPVTSMLISTDRKNSSCTYREALYPSVYKHDINCMYMVFGFMSAGIIILIILLVRLWLRNKSQNIEILDLQINSLKQDVKITHHRKDKKALEVMENLEKEQSSYTSPVPPAQPINKYFYLDRLCILYIDNYRPDSAMWINTIGNSVTETVRSMCNSYKFIPEIEKYLNRHRNNLISDFKKDFPNINIKEQHMFTLKAAGFSETAMSLLLDMKKGSWYSYRSRLRRKISNRECPRQYEYLAIMKKSKTRLPRPKPSDT